jgi:hypothetical protein
MAPNAPVGSAPAVAKLPDPRQFADQVRASIAQARTNSREREKQAGLQLEAELKQREVDAAAHAAEVIAGIPEKIRAETERWSADPGRPKYETMIMVIHRLDSTRACHLSGCESTSCPHHDPTKPILLYSARIVFDFCQQAFLAPKVVFHESNVRTGQEGYYAIHIEWTMPMYD